MTDAEPASSLVSAQLQVIIGRQIFVIALTPFRCPFRHLAGYTSTLKYNMSEMGGPAELSVGYYPVSGKGGCSETESAKRNAQNGHWWASLRSTYPSGMIRP
jgi:hypothetical protein